MTTFTVVVHIEHWDMRKKWIIAQYKAPGGNVQIPEVFTIRNYLVKAANFKVGEAR